MCLAKRGDQPLPKAQRLCMGVVHSEDAHALVDPELVDRSQLVPQRAPVRGREVEWIDVFVALRGILRRLDRAVGKVLEPTRVLAHPGMVRRALEGEVQCKLDAVRVRSLYESLKVRECPEVAIDRCMPPPW